MEKANAVCLIDADVLAYASAFVGQDNVLDKDDKVVDIDVHSFQWVSSYIDNMVDGIKDACNSTVAPFMFLTGEGNFRDSIATVKKYKGNRKADKPFHLANARMYIRSKYNTYLAKGCEADDLLAISMTNYRKDDVPCIICTIDKDLLQIEGWHYKWETHNSGEVMPHFVHNIGFVNGEYKDGISEKTGKPTRSFITKSFKGEGYMWFLAQTLAGDTADNIPGLPKWGGGKTYEYLKAIESKTEGLQAVVSAFKEVYDEETWEDALEEQARLVWMVRETDASSPDGLKHWSYKENNYAEAVSRKD